MRKPVPDLRIFKPDLMLETDLLQRGDPVNAKRLAGLIQRHLEIEASMKRIDMITYVILQRLPYSHRGKAEGNFNRVTSKPPHAAGIHTGSVPGNMILLKKGDMLPSSGQKIGGGTALYAATNDNDPVFSRWHLHAPAQQVHQPSMAG